MSISEQATVTLIMDGTPYVLTPTHTAMRALTRLQGGFLPLFRAVSNLDGETMALVVAIGTGARGNPVEDIAKAVYSHGLEDLVDPITRYLSLCTNGGRDPAAPSKPAGDAVEGKTMSEGGEPTGGAAPDKGAAEADAPTPCGAAAA